MTMNLKKLKAHKRSIQLDLDKMQREYEKSKTNHILHAIISIFSVGFWLIVWLFIALVNGSKRKKLEGMIDESRHAVMQIEDSVDEFREL